MKYVRGHGKPVAHASAVRMVLSRTSLIDRERLIVGIPLASAACSRLRPGPSATVFRTYAS